MHIDGYSFGEISINNKIYTSDVIVYPDRVDPSWWRKKGHSPVEADLRGIMEEKPDILIIGTGYSGMMRIPESTVDFLKSHGIEMHIQKTGVAVSLFNKQPAGRKIVGVFHLTC